jgi:flavodoxin
MKTLVVYYSNKGSNQYLAEKISGILACDIEQIQPRINVFLFFLMNIHLGNKPMKHQIGEYDRIILCGPIWMGKFIPPLRSFVKKYSKEIRKLVFVSSCGSTYGHKDDKFGHGLVFKEVEFLLKEKCVQCQAFPIELVLPEDQREDPKAFLEIHLNDENFKGEILEKFDQFIEQLNHDKLKK